MRILEGLGTDRIRCAIYARYSSNMQTEASIEEQIRCCRETARLKGWAVLPDHIYTDEAQTGRNGTRRLGLNALTAAAKDKEPRFEYVLVDDVSRLGRNGGDVLKIEEIFRHHDVHFYFVDKELDTRNPMARALLANLGMQAEEQIRYLARKVFLGQKGCVEKGMSSGSRCFGYISVPIPNPKKLNSYGRAAFLGKKMVVIEEEAIVIRQIFDLFIAGHSMMQIVEILHAEGVRSPRKPTIGDGDSAWNPNLIKNLLTRDKYRGVLTWNKTTQKLNPETGAIEIFKHPENEHVIVDAPHLRIVTDQQWEGAQAKLAELRVKNQAQIRGGHNRAKKKAYLFSGLLICGTCGNNLVISGCSHRCSTYECRNARFKRGCTNNFRIREDRLSDQLIDAISNQLLRPEIMESLVYFVARDLEEVIRQSRNGGAQSELDRLLHRKAELEKGARRILQYIRSVELADPILNDELREMTSELAHVSELITTKSLYTNVEVKPADLAALVSTCVGHLKDALHGDVVRARELLRRHVKQLTLCPVTTGGTRYFEVVGELDLFNPVLTETDGVLLDCSSTAIIQQHTVDSMFRFAGVRIFPDKDIAVHPLISRLHALFSARPELAGQSLLAKEWAQALAELEPSDSPLAERMHSAYVTAAFKLNQDQFHRHFQIESCRPYGTKRLEWRLQSTGISASECGPVAPLNV